MDKLVIKKGFLPNIAGKPSKNIKDLRWVSRLVIDPYSIPCVDPVVVIKDGQQIKKGDVLFTALHDSRIKFLSPGAGRVSVSNSIEIILDKEEFDREIFISAPVESLSRDEVKERLLSGGMWHAFCAYPRKRLANPDDVPPAIYVSLDDDEPFHPDPEVYLKGKVDELKMGIAILKKLTDGPVYVAAPFGNWRLQSLLSRLATHLIEGIYPANDPGVFLYHNKGSAYENKSWGIRGQAVMRIAKLFKEGMYPSECVAVSGGSFVKHPMHYRIREGIVLADMLENNVLEEECQIVIGGMFRGKKADLTKSLGYGADAVLAIGAVSDPKLLAPFRLGKAVTSYSKGFLSSFLKKPTLLSAALYEEERPCIGCDLCSDVCSVDILPQVILKHMELGETQHVLRHGLLDCVSCGLCTYVCPSKINLSKVLDQALDQCLETPQ